MSLKSSVFFYQTEKDVQGNSRKQNVWPSIFEYEKPTEPRITYLFLSLIRGYFSMETGSNSATSANERHVNEHVYYMGLK